MGLRAREHDLARQEYCGRCHPKITCAIGKGQGIREHGGPGGAAAAARAAQRSPAALRVCAGPVTLGPTTLTCARPSSRLLPAGRCRASPAGLAEDGSPRRSRAGHRTDAAARVHRAGQLDGKIQPQPLASTVRCCASPQRCPRHRRVESMVTAGLLQGRLPLAAFGVPCAERHGHDLRADL